jgi:hypothetical protein
MVGILTIVAADEPSPILPDRDGAMLAVVPLWKVMLAPAPAN